NCLVGHAGLFDPIAETYHKFAITETSISCERCHGPGALHVERHARGWHEATATDAVDDTIVNPARLPRELAEAVCQQCHLRSSAAVAVRGRSERDFRPGLPLQEFRYDLRFESGAEQFTVTGHVEQLRLSRCYQQSMMTCLTCHEPHDHPRPRRRADHYQRACLACHQPGQCNVAPEIRARQSPANQCVHCHMPQAATEVTHVALTHHRIGKHGLAERPLRTERGELRPVLPWLHADAATRKRSLGLGYLEIAGWLGSGPVGRVVQQQALALLTEMEEACQADPAVAAARLQLEPSLPVEDVIARADRIIAHPGTAARDRGDALWLRADALARIGRFDEAAADLRRLTTMRRKATDWLTLADVYRAAGREIDSIAAFESAVAINPRLWKVQRYLAEHFRRAGDVAKAAFHQARAVP
ncbi:MAG: hypothetical protein NZO58_04645, partial [Gemmataceae bacterium]|nr:hypothetical protein [Gemmataceae bacterium]